jgi:hypothetical protein
MTTRRLCRFCLTLGIMLAVASMGDAESVCFAQWGMLTIGTVERVPFTADAYFTFWKIGRDGNREQNGLPFIAHIARDRTGRVSIKMPVGWVSLKSKEAGDEATVWNTTICDPHNKTTTFITNSSVEVSNRGSIPGLYHFRGGASHPFEQPYKPPSANLTDLGFKDFDGIHAHGFRWWASDKSGPNEAKPREQWLSKTLSIELYHLETDLLTNEKSAVITHLRQVDPDPELFQIPQNLKDKVTLKDTGPPAH